MTALTQQKPWRKTGSGWGKKKKKKSGHNIKTTCFNFIMDTKIIYKKTNSDNQITTKCHFYPPHLKLNKCHPLLQSHDFTMTRMGLHVGEITSHIHTQTSSTPSGGATQQSLASFSVQPVSQTQVEEGREPVGGGETQEERFR